MTQIGLPFDWPADAAKSDYLVTDCNRHISDHVEHFARWPVKASVLIGQRKSGRSLLGRIFSANTGGRVIDDAEHVAESEIFHAWNVAQETRKPLLIIAQTAPIDWPVRLADLKSRLSATPLVDIGLPDPQLCAILIQNLLERRGMPILPEVAEFVANRMERDYVAIQRIVDVLDQASLQSKRAITKAFARETLTTAHLIS